MFVVITNIYFIADIHIHELTLLYCRRLHSRAGFIAKCKFAYAHINEINYQNYKFLYIRRICYRPTVKRFVSIPKLSENRNTWD